MKTFNFTYGTIEAKIKFSGGFGLWPAFWMVGAACQPAYLVAGADPPGCNWPYNTQGSSEVDIAEILDQNHTIINQAFIVGFGTGDNQFCGISGVSDVSQNWHTYSLTWSPGKLVWGVDVQTANARTCTITSPKVPDTPMFAIINTSGGGTAGAINNSLLPQTTTVDYVRVFQ